MKWNAYPLPLSSKQDMLIRCRRKMKNAVGLVYSIMFKFLEHMREYIKYKVRDFP